MMSLGRIVLGALLAVAASQAAATGDVSVASTGAQTEVPSVSAALAPPAPRATPVALDEDAPLVEPTLAELIAAEERATSERDAERVEAGQRAPEQAAPNQPAPAQPAPEQPAPNQPAPEQRGQSGDTDAARAARDADAAAAAASPASADTAPDAPEPVEAVRAGADDMSATPATAGTAAAAIGPPVIGPEGIDGSEQFVGPPSMANFRILGQEVLPGARARLEWTASQSFAGSEVISPVVVIHGVRPGPVLCLTAAVHGDELNGVEIVRRITRRLSPEALSGTVIAVPIVNLFGFSRNSRYLPDRRDLNRFFPGTPGGSIASRIAHSFFTQVVGHCEALVDFHTGSFDRSNLPQVRADLRLPEVLRFARGFGAVPVLHSNGNRGMLRVAATQANIPSVTFEVGAPAILQPVEIEAGVRAIDSLMHYLGMTPVAIDDQEPQAIFYDSVWVRANAGGLLLSSVELGQRVIPGQRLGIVVDPINDIEREILAPLYGRVIGMARNQVVLPGFAAFHVGEETSEERAVREAAAGIVPAVEEDPDPAPSENGGRDGDPIED
jgi:uncharacterized protein